MAYPKRMKGWRNITVDDQQFRWQFGLWSSELKGVLRLQGAISSGQEAIVTLYHWLDPWYSISRWHPGIRPNDPETITPHFAADAIRFALAHGWHPDQAGQPLCIDYKDKTFGLPEANSTTVATIS